MSSYVNINLIRFEYRGSWFAEAPGQIKEKMPVMWENEYDRKTHILETTWLSKGLDGDKKLGKYQKFQDFFKDLFKLRFINFFLINLEILILIQL